MRGVDQTGASFLIIRDDKDPWPEAKVIHAHDPTQEGHEGLYKDCPLLTTEAGFTIDPIEIFGLKPELKTRGLSSKEQLYSLTEYITQIREA